MRDSRARDFNLLFIAYQNGKYFEMLNALDQCRVLEFHTSFGEVLCLSPINDLCVYRLCKLKWNEIQRMGEKVKEIETLSSGNKKIDSFA